MKPNILVLCTGNSCRSQIAEGWLKSLAGGRAEIFSAGIEAHGLNPRAVAVMQEAGIDISGHTSNRIDEYAHLKFDYVITVCDNAREKCPFFPASVKMIHRDFEDPAKAAGTEEEILSVFRRVRHEIHGFSRSFVRESLGKVS